MFDTAHHLAGVLLSSDGGVFESLCLIISASLVDIEVLWDEAIGQRFPLDLGLGPRLFAHGVFTHTLVYTFTATVCAWLCFKTLTIVWRDLIDLRAPTFMLVLAATLSHLVLDVVTFERTCKFTHVYLWPL